MTNRAARRGARLALVAALAAAAAGQDAYRQAAQALDLMDYEAGVRLAETVLARAPRASLDLRLGQAFAWIRLGNLDEAWAAAGRAEAEFPGSWQPGAVRAYIAWARGAGEADVRKACLDAQKKIDAFYPPSGRTETRGRAAPAAGIPLDRSRTFVPAVKAPRARPRAEGSPLPKIPNAGLPSYISAFAAGRAGRWDEAELFGARALELGYKPRDAALGMARAAAGRGDRERAVRVLWEAMDARGLDADLLAAVALQCRDLGRASEALDALGLAFEIEPFAADLARGLGLLFLERAEGKAAAEWLRRAIHLGGDRVEIDGWLAKTGPGAGNEGKEIEAGLEMLRSKRCEPGSPELRYIFINSYEISANLANNRFMSLLQTGDPEQAAVFLKDFLALDGRSATLNYNLAQVRNSLRDPVGAFPFAWRASSEPAERNERRDILDLLGSLFFQATDFDRSIEFYERARGVDPEDALASFNLGTACAAAGRLETARAAWLESLRLERLPEAGKEPLEDPEALSRSVLVRDYPVSYLALVALGHLEEAQGNPAVGLDMFRRAAQIRPKSPEPYFEIGRILRSRGDEAQAESYFKTYLSLGGKEDKVKATIKE